MLTPDDDALRRELEPTVARLLERHCATASEWFPHDWLPWSRGRDFAGADGLAWASSQSPLSEAVRAALSLNLLTEENLPGYYHELLRRVGEDGAWGAWARRWTAEESRHASALRDYALLARALDPVALERERMAALQAGYRAPGKGLLQALVYAALQERATYIAHRNTGDATGDPVARRLLARIAADEHMHMVFYRELVATALNIAPAPALQAIAETVHGFEMPGAGLAGYLRASVLMADAGIYDIRLHCDQVILPMLQHWQVLTPAASGAEAREALLSLERALTHLERVAGRFERRRAARRALAERR